MNRSDSKLLLETIRQLYEVEQLPLQKIADRVGISTHSVWERLARAGVDRRPAIRPTLSIDRDELYQLYVTDGLHLNEIAKALKVCDEIVARELTRHSIERRSRDHWMRKWQGMDNLSVGESVIIECLKHPKPNDIIYSMAAERNIKVSTRRIAEDQLRITRVK